MRRLDNPRTGEIVEVVSHTEDELVLEATWPRPGHRAAEHIHPGMQETWEVLSGEAAFRIGGAEDVRLAPGESITAPSGVPHLAWNPTDGEVRLRMTLRPALRWLEVVERLFSYDGDDERGFVLALTRAYPGELAFPGRG